MLNVAFITQDECTGRVSFTHLSHTYDLMREMRKWKIYKKETFLEEKESSMKVSLRGLDLSGSSFIGVIALTNYMDSYNYTSHLTKCFYEAVNRRVTLLPSVDKAAVDLLVQKFKFNLKYVYIKLLIIQGVSANVPDEAGI